MHRIWQYRLQLGNADRDRSHGRSCDRNTSHQRSISIIASTKGRPLNRLFLRKIIKEDPGIETSGPGFLYGA